MKCIILALMVGLLTGCIRWGDGKNGGSFQLINLDNGADTYDTFNRTTLEDLHKAKDVCNDQLREIIDINSREFAKKLGECHNIEMKIQQVREMKH